MLALANGSIADSIEYRKQLLAMLREQKRWSAAIRLQEKLLEIDEQVAELDRPAQEAVFAGSSAQFQAELFFRNEQPYQAIEYLDEAIKKYDSVFGADNFLTSLISGRWIDLKLRFGGLPEAVAKIEASKKALAAKLGDDHPETIELLAVQATCHEVHADWQPYITCYESYLNKVTNIEAPNRLDLIAVAKRQLAFGYSRSLQFDLAARYFDESEELVRELYGESSLELAQWMFVRADDYVGTGEWKEGELLLEISLKHLDRLAASHSGRWTEPTLNNIRRCQAETIHRHALCALYDPEIDREFRLDRANKEFLQAKEILDNLKLNRSLRYVFVLRQLCEIEFLTKTSLPDQEASETLANAYIDEACNTYRFLCGAEIGPYYPLLQFYRIATARAWRKYDVAINEFYETVKHAPSSADKAQLAMCLREAGLTYAEMGQPAKATEVFSQAIDMYGECFFFELLSSSDSQADGYAEFSRDCLKDMVASADKSNPTQVESLFEYLSRIKGMVARAQAARCQLEVQIDNSIRAELSEKLFDIGGKIFNLIVEKAKTRESDPEIDDQIKLLSRRKRDLVAKLGNTITSNTIQFESNIVSRLKQNLPVNTTLVDIYLQPENQFVDEDIYYAFVFKSLADGYELSCERLGVADDLDGQANRLHDSALRRNDSVAAQAAFDSIGESLRKSIWDVISPLFGDSETIVICGDGLLGSVPWGGLPSGSNPGKYLVHDFIIVTATNSRDLVENLATNPPLGEGSLLVGNLEFGPPGKQGSANSPFAFCRLEESDRELKVVTPLLSSFGAVLTLQNNEASVGAVKKQLRLVRLAHFATHGFFIGSRHGGFKAHPFALTGLALSDANHADEPRFLSGEQVITMNLTNLDLVVLSACDTSQGLEINGEGIFGMQRAFLLAGAKSCIASRWPVEDEAARKFMELFYDNLVATGSSKIDAFRAAQIQMDETGYPAQAWANWQLLGDWR